MLSWLQESLQDLEELRREDPEEPVPLVPITEASAAALESELGQRLVSLLGAQKPADGVRLSDSCSGSEHTACSSHAFVVVLHHSI